MVYLNLAIFLIILGIMAYLHFHFKAWSLAKKVFIGLALGILFGFIMQFVYRDSMDVIKESTQWFAIVGSGYVKLLQMIVMPLIFISILSAISKLHQSASALGKISLSVISILLITTFIAACVGVIVTLTFHLTSDGLVNGITEQQRFAYLLGNQNKVLTQMNTPELILAFIPSNPFGDLAKMSATSIIGVVIFAIFLGIAALKLLKENSEAGHKVIAGIEIFQQWIMTLVRLVMQLTPYGVFALMLSLSATSDLQSILRLGLFIIASYVAIAIMFLIHGFFIFCSGGSFLGYFKKIGAVMAFAFTSRSSAASIPLNIETQMKQFNVPESIAGFSASFGATIGQNGCAGIYPAMLAVMVATGMGIPIDFHFMIILVCIVTLSSIGVAGVGGGATFAALMVLPMLGLPIEIVALLVSIEPLIDMGRTALNVSDSMVSGIVTSRILKTS